MSDKETVGSDFPQMVYAETGGENDGTPFGESRIVNSPEELAEAEEDGFFTADEILEYIANPPDPDKKKPEGDPPLKELENPKKKKG